MLSIIGPNLIEFPKTLDKNPILKIKNAITKPNMKLHKVYLDKYFLMICKAFGLLPAIVSAVNCLVRSSNKIPVFLYLECFTFIINCNLSVYKYRLFSKT